MRSTRLFAMVICLAAATAFAQDPSKVEPTHYRLAFANEHVEVISVHYAPHEKSGMHDHPGGVVVAITKAHLRFTDQNGRTQEVYSQPGEARWFPALRHQVENLGDTPYNAVYIAVKTRTAVAKNGLVVDPETRKTVDQIVAALTQQY